MVDLVLIAVAGLVPGALWTGGLVTLSHGFYYRRKRRSVTFKDHVPEYKRRYYCLRWAIEDYETDWSKVARVIPAGIVVAWFATVVGILAAIGFWEVVG